MTFTRDWLNDGTVLYYRISKLDAFDQVKWSDDVVQTMQSWNPVNDYYVLFDLKTRYVSLPYLVLTGRDLFNVGVTSSGKTRIQSLMEDKKNKKIYLALILSSSASGQILQKHQAADKSSDPIVGKIFHNIDSALQWLSSQSRPWQELQTKPITPQDIEKVDNAKVIDNLSSSIPPGKVINLSINGAMEKVNFPESGRILFGHKIGDLHESVDVDLSTFDFSVSSISGRHAEIIIRNNGLYVVDLNSTNGTYVSGVRLTPNIPYAIRENDVITLGNIIIELTSVE